MPLLAALALSAGGTAAQEVLTPDEMRSAALGATAAGAPETALTLSDALLARDPDDATALLLRARALRDLGRADAARRAAAEAWAAAESDAERYRAAMVRAQALATDGAWTRAQIWLRRAAQLAPDARSRKVAERDYGYVRARNPLGVQLTFDVAPTNNVNGGSSESEAVLRVFGDDFRVGLRGASRAISGMRYGAGANLTYRLDSDARSRTNVALSVYHETYTISEDSKERLREDARDLQFDDDALPPEIVEGSDFAYSVLTAGIERRFFLREGGGLYETGLTLGQNWYGGDPLSRFVRLRGGKTFQLDGTARASVGVTLEYQDRQDVDDATPLRLGVELQRRAPVRGGGAITLGADLRRSLSDRASFDYVEAALSADWRLGEPVMGSVVTLSSEGRLREFDSSPYRAGGRSDTSLTLGAELFFPDIDAYGFAPLVEVEALKRESNIDLYDTETVNLRLGFRSVF
ncbi:hypothetical protein SAMN04490244_11058 [Tranquillimonas rosea]|uniref:Tetratricopeptide repeat-containing protein n=1 Tax=Tranquillimonas rosea TaxID=641238 RepID=A0A1H9WC20_9RHOB|nr:hypothetical protein [Tranquillimonas rosea]SES31502.1 hypothetical protein SAMN04490244_11058 [Tranquillimonas rosea]